MRSERGVAISHIARAPTYDSTCTNRHILSTYATASDHVLSNTKFNVYEYESALRFLKGVHQFIHRFNLSVGVANCVVHIPTRRIVKEIYTNKPKKQKEVKGV
jgi:hypothetical protein